MKKVFLCGPMRGVDRTESLKWRREAETLLKDNFIVKHAFRGREDHETFPDPKGPVIRDKQDVVDSDILIVNDTLNEASMIGTSMEILLAYNAGKTIIVFGDAHKGDYWLDYHSTMRVLDLESACKICKDLLYD